MGDVAVPTAPPLATVAGVELMHAGQWDISTGRFTFTPDDFHSAVAALDCPAVRRPVLKLGHTEPDPDQNGIRWDGEPAVGWISNMGVADAGHTLVGDYTGMPGWLGDVIASAYPDRSVEGQYDFRCQIGHLHPFVITAVALLGVAAPGIGTLQSLQDVAALYGVAAAADPAQVGTSFALTIHAAAAREDRVPNPTPLQVTATVTSEDVRRAFYGSEYGRGWDIYIQEMQLGPELQLIVCDESTGTLSRVALVIGEGDGEDAVSFGDPVKVVVRYEDSTAAVAAGAGAGERVIRFASRAESRPGERPASEPESVLTAEQWQQIALLAAAQPADIAAATEAQAVEPAPETTPATPVEESTTTEGSRSMDTALIRTALGLPPEATDEEVSAALAENGLVTPAATAETVEPEAEVVAPVAPVAPALPEGVVTIDETALAELREQALQGVAARAQQVSEARTRDLDDAIKAGKIPPATREHWDRLYQADPAGIKATLGTLAPGLVPVEDAGVPGGAETTTPDEFADFDRYFSKPVPTGKGA